MDQRGEDYVVSAEVAGKSPRVAAGPSQGGKRSARPSKGVAAKQPRLVDPSARGRGNPSKTSGRKAGSISRKQVRELELHEIGEYHPTKDASPIIVRAFVCEDGSAGADGVVLGEGKLYASCSKSGPHNTFFPFDGKRMKLNSSGTVVQELRRPSILSSEVKPVDVPRYGPIVRFRAVELRDEGLVVKRLRQEMIELLRDYPGVRLVVARPSFRPDIPIVHELYVKGHGRV